jgi:glycosyltransferase involved in cell wall biosynthesis
MAEKLNICLMNDSFPPVIDGVANAVINYANVIHSELGNVTVATPDYPNVEDDYPFEVVRYRSMKVTEKICGYRAGYPFSSSNLDKLAEGGLDVIHSHCPFASTMMARVLREKCGAPIILTYHTKFDIDIHRALPNEIMAKQAIKFIVSNIAACDEVWTVSHGAGENLRSLGFEGKYIVMENGVDFPCGRADKDETAELRAAYGVEEGVPLFLFVGRLLWYKGIRLILDALKLIHDKGIDFRMMFVGDGADRQEIEDYAKELGLTDRCIFTGAVYDREELRVYYTAGDLFLFPSEYDTNGIVVREAAACGVGALLIDGSCAAEGITHGRTGILTEANAEAIAAELEFVCSHLDEVHQIGEHAMNEVYISWETSVKRAYDRYFAVIENVKSGQSQRREGLIQEEFFSAMDNITDRIQLFRSIPSRLKSTKDKNGRKWQRIKNNIKENITKK